MTRHVSHGKRDRLTHWMPVSMNTYSSLSQSNSTYKPMLLKRLTHTNPASKRASGSSRNTFITIPSVLNDRRVEKDGLICSSDPGFCSGKWICMSSNCITFSSSLERVIRRRKDKTSWKEKRTRDSLSAKDLGHSKVYNTLFKLHSTLPQLPSFSRVPFGDADVTMHVPANHLAALRRAKRVTCGDGGEPVNFFVRWRSDHLVPVLRLYPPSRCVG